jgi:HAMP domain-containing protein
MTAAPVDSPRPADTDGRFRFVRGLILVEELLTAAEVALLIGPTLALAAISLHRAGDARLVAMVVSAAMVAGWVRAADLLRPIAAARNAKRAGRALDPAEIAAVERAVRRAPFEVAFTRWLLWSAAAIYVAVHMASHDLLAWPSAIGVASIALLHAGGAAAARAALWERRLLGARRLVLPNFDALRNFAAGYRRWLCQTAVILLALAHAVNAALISVFTELTSAQSGTLLALTVPALLIPMMLWYRSLRRRTAAIERYFEIAVRHPGARGPAREDPDAIAAFRAAQGLPYRLSGYQALACAFAVVAVALIGRKLCGLDTGTAGRLLGASALLLLAMALYETLLLRDVLRPLLAQLGARHRLPVDEVRARITLRTKLVFFFSSVTAFTSGLVLLFALSPRHPPWVMLASIGLALALALGLVLLIVRDMVNPVRALEERSDEMARGELARPVPPSGEADEIGRLSFAFEEMRRALRDKLRSTESSR